MAEMLEFKFDTQLLIEGHDLDEDEINDYITEHFKGDCLLAVGDDELIKIHFHTNEPWQVLEYCASLGEIYDIVVEDMDRQSRGLKSTTLWWRTCSCRAKASTANCTQYKGALSGSVVGTAPCLCDMIFQTTVHHNCGMSFSLLGGKMAMPFENRLY